jgi:hemerythrin-like domain-containing protein
MVKSKKTISTRAKKKSLAKSSSMDIINLILTDHKPLKQLIKILKREKSNYAQKLAAFNDFAPLLVAHAKPEEQTWYGDLRGGGKSGLEMRIMGIEGEIEHGLADQL